MLFVAVGNPKAAGVFSPSVKIETSTTRATAHPDARITIDNSASDENIKDLTLDLPDGFWGSLAAVDSKCTESDAVAGDCAEASRIGTVTAKALIVDPDSGTEANGVLSGGVYLTETFAANAASDPAGISIEVDAKVGGVDLGKVIVNGRAVARNKQLLAPTTPTGAVGPVRGITTVVTDIPESVTDPVRSRTVDYLVKTMQIDLLSDLDGDNPPLITNPSKCGPAEISGEATPYGGGSAVPVSDEYVVDGCETTKFAPSASVTLTNPVAGELSGLTAEINFGEGESTLKSVTSTLPPTAAPNLPAFGAAADRCSGGAGTNFTPSGQEELGRLFNPTAASCPDAAKFGRVTIETPLLSDPVEGDVYLINKTPLPWLGIDVSPETGNDNPAGVTIRMLGITDLVPVDPSCTSDCQEQITVKFDNSPDAPVSKISLNLNLPDRPKALNPSIMLSSKLLEIVEPGSAQCLRDGDMPFVFGNNSETDDGASVSKLLFSGCLPDPPSIAITSGVADGTPGSGRTTDRTPSFDFSYSGTEDLLCAIDTFEADAEPCSPPSYSYTGDPLDNGIHQVFVSEDGGSLFRSVRSFVVTDDPASSDSSSPTTTLDTVPATTSDSTPAFTFNASETSSFQCSLDGGAFLPCGSAAGTASTSYSIPPDEELFASDDTHTFAVRAQDTAGNVDLTPASATFKVVIPFAPTMSVNLSTTQARAHPDMTINIGNLSHEDVKDYSLSMPDGFFGGLTGVQALCEIADADNGACGAGSKVGTVTATAVIDRSTVTTTGKVYLTKPRVIGDPAGLIIDVTPKLQDVTFEPIRVPARLAVRGRSAQGIDSIVIDVPNTATSTENEVSEFDMRSISLTLKSNPAAPQPLLTNPSSCEPKAFKASFTGYDNTIGSYDAPFAATGCGALGFAPALGITQVERTTGGNPGPSDNIRRAVIDLTANLTSDPNGAGIKSVSLTMPRPISIDVQRLPFPCLDEQAAAKACPASAAIGTVTATTPLLDKPISGLVYVLKSATSLPRLLIALRGDIDVDLIATNSFLNATTKPQIITQMDTLPDVPLSSFTMKINGFLTTRVDACDTGPQDWNITGALAAHNGSASAVNIPLGFNCPNATLPIYNYSLKGKGSKTSLLVDLTAQGSKQVKKTTLKLPKGLSFNKKGFTKKKLAKLVTVRGDGKKLKAKCFKLKSSTTFEINFCKKSVTTASVQFKSGTLNMKKKIKKPKFKVTVTDSDNKKKSAKYVK